MLVTCHQSTHDVSSWAPVSCLILKCMPTLTQGDTSALEIAAEKMTSAVQLLVQMEREIVALTESGVSFGKPTIS